ncbi:MAG: tRNA uridine-5-carboxymethylaminomethyl(34) synthesis GTPase MnmE, partial [Clostridia bacterium]|nr:tRNA uridine-5-carboxymethylaminomethyl(34) synthesis GTPase MnmE [Clostridia bacterium]
PHSFTGEDTVEISCHGGILLTQRVLESVLLAGCRMAEAGEFTKRAFLNGKISLSQAEAVIGLIDAASEEQLKLASATSRGVLHGRVEAIAEELTDLIASVYAYIDYPDEDLADLTAEELAEGASRLHREVSALAASYRAGRAVNEGVPTVIAGKPNTGKSSILNRLLGRDRAIVTDVAGTTRDTVEETASVGRVTLRLCDTAGLRDADNEVERIGVEKSREKLREAGLVLAVFDGSRPLDEEDLAFIDELIQLEGCEILPILNKSDLVCATADLPFDRESLSVSAVTGDGFDRLAERISSLFISEKLDYDTTPILSSARQFAAAKAAEEHLRSACEALSSGFTQDVAGMDLELALARLREIDGRGVTEEITDRIFHRFCVGK